MRRWGAARSLPLGAAAVALLLVAVVASPAVSSASDRAAPRGEVPSALPALHAVSAWVADGLKLKTASSAVQSQLPGNAYEWVPISACLTTAIDSSDATPCDLGDPAASPTVVLFGDSSADEWALYLGALGVLDHFKVVVYVHAACPVGDITVELAGSSPDPTCTTFRTTVQSDLEVMRPAPQLVVVSELRLSNYETGSGGTVTNTAWSSALTEALKQIEGDGLAVVSVHGIPISSNPATCIAAYTTQLAKCTTALKSADPGKYDAATASGAKAAHAGGVDLRPIFCTSGGCPVVADGDVTHAGTNHVTERYAAAVQGALAELIGCEVEQSFSNAAKAAPVFRALNGTKPKAAYLQACEGLAH